MPQGKPSAKKPRRPARRRPAKPAPKPVSKRIGTVAAPRGVSERASEFPIPENLWCRFFDDRLPYWVKRKYLPRHAQTEGGFNETDAKFFAPAISSLSKMFTERTLETEASAYFSEKRFRSSYLLYFVPLQAAKFTRLFHIHSAAIRKAIAEGTRQGVFRVADLGAGPATASLALLAWLVAEHDLHKAGKEMPPIELHLLDTDAEILEDGVALIDEFRRIFGIAADKITVRTHVASISEAPERIKGDLALVLAGNVFNESLGIHMQGALEWIPKVLSQCAGGGILLLEPAVPENSAFLTGLRDRLLQSGVLARDGGSIWGPCLHAGPCPLRDSRDWCHFSAPGGVPGHWFRIFSESLGSERQWVKFSYLWLAAPGSPRPPKHASDSLRRVVSDQIPDKRGGKTLLICEPNRPLRATAPNKPLISRGDLVTVRPFRRKRIFGERQG